MNTIEAGEISAYLDGELSAERAQAVRAAIDTQPELQAAVQRLASLDRRWQRAADAAHFSPAIVMPPAKGSLRGALFAAGAVVGLITIRVVPKLLESLEWGVLINGVGLAVIAIWLAKFVSSAPADSPAFDVGLRHE
jgi:anti-sigma factor RsiW